MWVETWYLPFCIWLILFSMIISSSCNFLKIQLFNLEISFPTKTSPTYSPLLYRCAAKANTQIKSEYLNCQLFYFPYLILLCLFLFFGSVLMSNREECIHQEWVEFGWLGEWGLLPAACWVHFMGHGLLYVPEIIEMQMWACLPSKCLARLRAWLGWLFNKLE